VPFVHFFDGFRTSHEINKAAVPDDSILRAMIDEEWIKAHQSRALTPDRPVLRGTSQNPDVYFQSREASNPYYDAVSGIVEKAMDRFGKLTGRSYRLFDYCGAPDAERVIILMGSAAETAAATAKALGARGEKVGVLKVRLFRPFDVRSFAAVLPNTVRSIAVLDRTKEPGSAGEPLLLDVICALHDERPGIRAIGGRYGLSSKELTPAMVKAVFDEMAQPSPKRRFTVGIHDDVTSLSLDYDSSFSIEPATTKRAVFFGLGSDGTVGANKNTIHIIGDKTPSYVQAYFIYDSKKAGAMTVSHLRFGPEPIHAPYLIEKADFLACHQPEFIERLSMLALLAPGGTFLLNSPIPPDNIWDSLPKPCQEQLSAKKARFYVIDASKVASDCGLGGRINTVMQACFFAVSGILPLDEALAAVREAIAQAYGKKSGELVEKNLRAVDAAIHELHEVKIPSGPPRGHAIPQTMSQAAPEFVRKVLAPAYAGLGDKLPVSAMPADGTFPTDTARWEKRALAQSLPVWDPAICILCAKCAIVCPHAAIRPKVYAPDLLKDAPAGFKFCEPKDLEWKGLKYTLQVAPDDCTGCGICVDVCPVRNKSETRLKAINMEPAEPLRPRERPAWDFFLGLPDPDRRKIKASSVRHEQYERPLFEFSSACSGCGETPYLKLLSQLFGDRLLIANATGCSSIYGGNLPTTPWAKNAEGRGPAWANSLFEDNAEFGLGLRLSVDQHQTTARALLAELVPSIDAAFAREILDARQDGEADLYDQRHRVAALKEKLAGLKDPRAGRLTQLADYLVRKSATAGSITFSPRATTSRFSF
jgi:pyruvate-ferredoxin/flavodoxin oxidoreductase